MVTTDSNGYIFYSDNFRQTRCILSQVSIIGTGKTYTMLGTDSDPGIMVLTLNDLFKQMQQDRNVMKYRATIAYLEVIICHF